jgi:hypothetical protein
MSSEDPYKSPSEHEPKKSNTVLIVIVVLVVLAIPALCICGGAAAWLFMAVRVESLQNEPPFVDGPIIEIPPIEPVPPIEAAPGDEPLSGDPATTK